MTAEFVMRIDDPEDRVLRSPICRVRGWCAAGDWSALSQLELRLADGPVRWQPQQRPDVAAEYPELWVAGFVLNLDLSQYPYAIRSSELSLCATFPHSPELKVQLSVAPGLAAKCFAAVAGI